MTCLSRSLILLVFIILKVLAQIVILNHKHVHSVYYFVCHNSSNLISTYNDLAKLNIYVAIREMKSDKRNKFNVNQYNKIGMIIDATCPGWTEAVDLNDYLMFKNPFVWVFVTDDLHSTAHSLSQYPIDLDSDVTIMYSTENSCVLLYEVYNTGFRAKGEFIINHIGFWNSTLNISKLERRDLRQIVIKCVVVVTQNIVNETFQHFLERPKQNTFDLLHKLKSFTILEYFQDMYNFRPCFIFRHPKHSGGYLSIYTRPLDITVWLSIITLLTLSGMFLCCIFKLRVFGTRGNEDASLAFLFVLSAICQQGMSLKTSSLSIKITVFVTFVFTLTLYQYYNATVVSTLLRETPKSIRTLNDLLKSNLKVGVEDVLYDKDYFKRTTDPIAIELYHKKIVNGKSYNFYPIEHGLSLVKFGGFAFHVDSSAAYFVMRRIFSEQELCELQEVALYPPQNMGAVVRKGSPYKELIAYGLRRMFEAGLMHRLKSVWDVPKPPCVKTPGSNTFAVSIREFSMALIILFFGMVASVLILFLEIITLHIKNRKRVFRVSRMNLYCNVID